MLYNLNVKSKMQNVIHTKKRKWNHRFVVIILSMFLFSCSNQNTSSSTKTSTLVVFSPHPLELIDPIISEFEADFDVQVNIIFAGTGELLAKIEDEIEEPSGDVMWGGSITTLESNSTLFHMYNSSNEDEVYPEHKNEAGYVTRFSIIPSVIMINDNLIGDIVVDGYLDLLNPRLKGKIAFADPSKSSSSFEHVINQLYAMGEGNPDSAWAYLEKFIGQLEGKLLSGSPEVYRGVANGQYSIGLTFEEAAAKYVRDGAPVSIVYPKEGTIVKADGVAIIKNAKNLVNAKAFVDFVTSHEIQTLISTELNRRSVRMDVGVAEGLKEIKDIYVIQDDSEWIAENRASVLNHYFELFDKTK